MILDKEHISTYMVALIICIIILIIIKTLKIHNSLVDKIVDIINNTIKTIYPLFIITFINFIVENMNPIPIFIDSLQAPTIDIEQHLPDDHLDNLLGIDEPLSDDYLDNLLGIEVK